MTVGELRKACENLPDDAPVLVHALSEEEIRIVHDALVARIAAGGAVVRGYGYYPLLVCPTGKSLTIIARIGD